MPEQNGEKSQDPTPYRRQKAREEGQVARSHDLVSALVLLGGTLALMMAGRAALDALIRLSRYHLGGEAWLRMDVSDAVALFRQVLWELTLVLGPVLVAMMVVAAAANFLQTGFLFLPQKLVPDFSRLDPWKGFGRIFSLSNAFRLGLGLVKLSAVAAVALLYLNSRRDEILGLADLEMLPLAWYLGDLLLGVTLRLGLALLVLAVLDFGFQFWKHEQDLKMTPQEVREELRNLEGDPQIAARRRMVQRQLVLNRVNQAVPKADVVVTNPTELAVALQYDPEKMAAPVVVAKGAGLVAANIRRLALQHGIPIIEKKPLAQALFRDVEVNQPIPRELYAAVAEVLAYVYQLQGKRPPIPQQRAA
ncbi:MAG: flagellar biosynthesis protein FlhB [Thermogutta sp.]